MLRSKKMQPGVHTLSGCIMVLYPFRKGKQSALRLLVIDTPGLNQVLRQPCMTHAQLKVTEELSSSYYLWTEELYKYE